MIFRYIGKKSHGLTYKYYKLWSYKDRCKKRLDLK